MGARRPDAAMRDSGRGLDWDLNGPVLDKHSNWRRGRLCKALCLARPFGGLRGPLLPIDLGRGLAHNRRDARQARKAIPAG